ncbi:MAG TPA: hypothetical protein VFY61_08075, partial [Pyrinomonadaceae bacterium]|nr:hypothetical protein [Pyrinomonadaceae bacterium]
GQGTVYRAVDTTLDRPAVVKVLPPALTDSPSNLVRFEREAKLASSLDHPNICTISGCTKWTACTSSQCSLSRAATSATS